MYIIQEIPRHYTAFAEWMAATLYILSLRKKVNQRQLFFIAAAFFVWQQILLGLTGNAPIFLWVPIMFLAVGSLCIYIYITCEIPGRDIGFCCARIFVLAEFVAALEWQIYTFFTQNGLFKVEWQKDLFAFLVYAFAFFIDYLVEIRKLPKEHGLDVKQRELVNTLLIALTIFLFSNMSFLSVNTPFSAKNMQEIFYIRTLVDLCGVLLLYSQQDERQKRMLSHEMEAMNEMLIRQYNQYQISHNNIEVLNQKYHDLKHQIIAIRQEENIEKKEQYLLDMENRIKLYESEYKTGNHVLDILLTTKAGYCNLNNINFNCVADGKAIAFMETMDICSVFGNALDNAIESVEKQRNIEKRLIRTAVYAKGKFTMIRFENYTEEPVTMKEGLPKTTKKDKQFHGYGLKGIHSIAQKYGGTMTINVEGNWFILRILLPIPQKETK